MSLNPTPELINNLYLITLFAVIVSSASGVLKAGFKKFDLALKKLMFLQTISQKNQRILSLLSTVQNHLKDEV